MSQEFQSSFLSELDAQPGFFETNANILMQKALARQRLELTSVSNPDFDLILEQESRDKRWLEMRDNDHKKSELEHRIFWLDQEIADMKDSLLIRYYQALARLGRI